MMLNLRNASSHGSLEPERVCLSWTWLTESSKVTKRPSMWVANREQLVFTEDLGLRLLFLAISDLPTFQLSPIRMLSISETSFPSLMFKLVASMALLILILGLWECQNNGSTPVVVLKACTVNLSVCCVCKCWTLEYDRMFVWKCCETWVCAISEDTI